MPALPRSRCDCLGSSTLHAQAVGQERQLCGDRMVALVPAAVAAMAVVMQIDDDPTATTGSTVMFVVAASAFQLGAAWLYRPMLQNRTD